MKKATAFLVEFWVLELIALNSTYGLACFAGALILNKQNVMCSYMFISTYIYIRISSSFFLKIDRKHISDGWLSCKITSVTPGDARRSLARKSYAEGRGPNLSLRKQPLLIGGCSLFLWSILFGMIRKIDPKVLNGKRHRLSNCQLRKS